MPFTRRRFVAASAAALTCRPLSSFAQQITTAPAGVTLHPDQPGATVPANFIGLSYETQQLSDPTFFSATNSRLVAQFRALSPNGVLRLGGNTSDYAFWKPTPTSVAPPRTRREYKVGDPDPNLSYPVTPQAVQNLLAFLQATGWTCLYGINLGTNTPALAADEAAYVAKALGARLEYFQIGNEADRFATTIRDPKTWGVDAFLDEWLTFAKAILARVPGARFGMPDIASDEKWFAGVSARLAGDPIRGHIACLSHHYYVGGPPSNPQMTIQRILKSDPRVPRVAGIVSSAAAKLGAPWRMTEGNTCYRGGKPGVSDVFAAALWSADYLLTLASLGYAGVNLHGGDGQMVANSLGGTLPGEELMPDRTVPHARPFYTPVAHIGESYVLEPVAYGMQFAALFAGATMFPVDFNPGAVNATAYAGKLPTGQIAVAVINKDEKQSLALDLPGYSLAHVLQGPSLTAKTAQLTKPARFREASSIPPATAYLFNNTRS